MDQYGRIGGNATTTVSRGSVLATNKVLRNTYLLLAATLLFSAVMAVVAMAQGWGFRSPVLFLAVFFGLQFLIAKFRNTGWALLLVFALTGFMGAYLGPLLEMYRSVVPGGSQIVATALASTGIIFLSLSAYVLTTRKDFSFAGGFLFIGIWVAFLAGIAAWLFQMPALSLAVSAMFTLLMSGYILWQTSAIIHGGERNYVLATVGLYVSIFNLFTSLLHLLTAFGDD